MLDIREVITFMEGQVMEEGRKGLLRSGNACFLTWELVTWTHLL